MTQHRNVGKEQNLKGEWSPETQRLRSLLGRGTVPRRKTGESLLSPNIKSNAWGPAGGQAAARAPLRNSRSVNECSVR